MYWTSSYSFLSLKVWRGDGGEFVNGFDSEVLELSRHHPDAGEDQTTKADNCSGVDCERLGHSQETLYEEGCCAKFFHYSHQPSHFRVFDSH